jgi:acetyltransferase-like isoleucine patch superfamily enzyme
MGFKLKYLYFAGRLALLALTAPRRFVAEGWAAALEPGSAASVDKASQIRLGRRVYVKRGARIEAYDGGRVEIGARSFLNRDCQIVSRVGISIGRNCMIGDGVGIFDHNHRTDRPDLPFRDQGYVGAPIRIGDNVWIGRQAFIGAGVTIGDNVVIGAHAIITKDVPSNTVAYSRSTLVLRPLAGAGPVSAEAAE